MNSKLSIDAVLGTQCSLGAEAIKKTEVFSIKEGEYKLLLDGELVAAEWNSKGAAEAAIPVERARRLKKLLKVCQLCHRKNLEQYVDGKTTYGPWANMCIDCHASLGCGLGTGRGQQYALLEGKWNKTAG